MTYRTDSKRVERVLSGLDHPEPPLRLEDVRELLKLDRRFYTADDPSAARETISKIRVAAIQVYKRPTLLLDAIKKLSLKALYLPDRKRILLDGSLPEKKHRWNEAHEVGHSLIPWHEDVMMGDNDYTLKPDCHEHVEAEANFAAGRLLFLRDRFTAEARSMSPCIDSVLNLHKKFGNTISTTLYRFIEMRGSDTPLVGMITKHPHISRREDDFDPHNPCRYFIQSPSFAGKFSSLSEVDLFNTVSKYCSNQRGGMIGTSELIISDDNGEDHRFYFETFFNRYDALTLGIYVRREYRSLSMSA